MTLRDKHALITRSSRGIGRGIALKLAESGVIVMTGTAQWKETPQLSLVSNEL